MPLLAQWQYGYRRSVWDGAWFDTPETYLHVGISAAVVIFVYSWMCSRGSARRQATLAAIAVALLLGIGRELFNLWQSLTMPWMFFSMKDMVWNGVGIAIGLLLSRLDDPTGPRPSPRSRHS